MLDEKVLGPSRDYTYAFLIELKTIAGLSGSPVFLNIAWPAQLRLNQAPENLFVALGILVGYHVVESKEDQIQVPQFQGVISAGSESIDSVDQRNTGFGVVIPFTRVFDIIEKPHVQSMLDEAIENHKISSPFREA